MAPAEKVAGPGFDPPPARCRVDVRISTIVRRVWPLCKVGLEGNLSSRSERRETRGTDCRQGAWRAQSRADLAFSSWLVPFSASWMPSGWAALTCDWPFITAPNFGTRQCVGSSGSRPSIVKPISLSWLSFGSGWSGISR